MIVELIYDLTCPNVKATRENLLKAFTKVSLPAKWQEWDRNDPSSPPHIQQYGSPTILVDGQDIADEDPTLNNCCRIYHDQSTNTLSPIPTVTTISEKLQKSNMGKDDKEQKVSLKSLITILPGVFVALLPKLTCPLCWPTYTGLLSVFGISFTNYTPYLFPLMLVFLIIALFTLYYKAPLRHGYYPLYFGSASTLIIILGKFVFHSNIMLYIGVALLLIASIWNSWPRKKRNCCN